MNILRKKDSEKIPKIPKERIDLPGATLPFFKYEEEGLTCFEFNSTKSDPPIPMVNAMRGLELIKRPEDRLVMQNMQEPMGLYPKIAETFEWEVTVLENSDMQIVFKLK
ncbi:MAG: hypothetical protein DRG24_01595 [Epsilonproteobacteria bacterium]|nr:MAG: hypothetical protein DRG24_01595 [Campylobacterota bacterium]